MSTNLLWNALIDVRKKLALTGIFSLTIFVISVSITRVVLTTSGPRLDLTWLLLWSGLEMTVGTHFMPYSMISFPLTLQLTEHHFSNHCRLPRLFQNTVHKFRTLQAFRTHRKSNKQRCRVSRQRSWIPTQRPSAQLDIYQCKRVQP